jgi:flavin reductase (DIM6/NTAB) family NADH-FMN oxidoreductase RutF
VGVGVPSEDRAGLFYSDAARRADDFDSIACVESPTGLPLLRDAMASLDCRADETANAGDDTLFIAGVEHVVWRGDDRPLSSQDLDYVYVGEVVKRR